MTSNEIRQVIGMKPSSDPKADQLVNSNINQASSVNNGEYDEYYEEGESQNGVDQVWF